jgi:hypothetical protein
MTMMIMISEAKEDWPLLRASWARRKDRARGLGQIFASIFLLPAGRTFNISGTSFLSSFCGLMLKERRTFV